MASVSEELSRAVSAEVRRLIADRKWSGRELSRQAGLVPSVVAYKLKGERSFDVDDLAAIARALGVRVSDLIGRVEQRPV